MIASRHLGLLGVILFAACAHAQNKEANLAKLDASSKTFVNFQADVKQESFTRLVKQTETTTGKMFSIRGKGGDEIGIQIGTRTVHYQNGVLKDFTGGLGCYNVYSADKNKGTFDTILTLAFGSSGKSLAAKWNITDEGPQTLTVDGKPTQLEELDLVPMEQGLKNNISHIKLWMDLDKDYSPKLITFSPSGDTVTATYSNIRLNAGKVDTKPFEIKGKPCK